jgi:uncharacterized protein YjbI with pentapeptide repeats
MEIRFEGANLIGAGLKRVDLKGAHLKGAHLEGADLEGADLEGADLEGADLTGAKLEEASGLSVDQLSKVKTLHNTKLDEELFLLLNKKYPTLFEVPELSALKDQERQQPLR